LKSVEHYSGCKFYAMRMNPPEFCMGKLVLNYTSCSGMHPVLNMRSHCSMFEEDGHFILPCNLLLFLMTKLKL